MDKQNVCVCGGWGCIENKNLKHTPFSFKLSLFPHMIPRSSALLNSLLLRSNSRPWQNLLHLVWHAAKMQSVQEREARTCRIHMWLSRTGVGKSHPSWWKETELKTAVLSWEDTSTCLLVEGQLQLTLELHSQNISHMMVLGMFRLATRRSSWVHSRGHRRLSQERWQHESVTPVLKGLRQGDYEFKDGLAIYQNLPVSKTKNKQKKTNMKDWYPLNLYPDY